MMEKNQPNVSKDEEDLENFLRDELGIDDLEKLAKARELLSKRLFLDSFLASGGLVVLLPGDYEIPRQNMPTYRTPRS